jgi:pSer/pThr/pTyr-binding forkhead associated (FHA) protein
MDIRAADRSTFQPIKRSRVLARWQDLLPGPTKSFMTTTHKYDDRHILPYPKRRPQGPLVELVIERGTAENLTRRVEGPVYMIGTGTECDMVLSDKQFADYHVYLCLREGQLTLRHLGRQPLVTVNGRMIRWGEILNGDRIRMGSYEFLVKIRSQQRQTGAPVNVGAVRRADDANVSAADTPHLPIVSIEGPVESIEGPVESIGGAC